MLLPRHAVQTAPPHPPLLERIVNFGRSLIYKDIRKLPPRRRPLAYFVRLLRETARDLTAANALIRASALAFQTLLALVPFVVVVVGVAAGLFPDRSDQVLDRIVQELIPADAGAVRGARDVLFEARATLRTQLGAISTHARGINIVGFSLLLVTVLSLLSAIEQTINVIWRVRRARGWLDKLPHYVAILFLAPLFLIGSISLTTTSHALGAAAPAAGVVAPPPPTPWLEGAPGFVTRLVLPVVLMTLALWVTYIWLPSVRVRRRAALVAAFLAAMGLELLKRLFLSGAISVVRTNAVYGSLAVLPILFLWLYLSWAVILFGAAVAFVTQNFRDVAKRAEETRRGLEWRLYFALRIALEAARRFARGESPKIVPRLVEEFDVPEYAIRDVCAALVESRVLVPVAGDPDAFVPGKTLNVLTVDEVLTAAGQPVVGVPADRSDPVHAVIAATLERLRVARTDSIGRLTLGELVDEIARAER